PEPVELDRAVLVINAAVEVQIGCEVVVGYGGSHKLDVCLVYDAISIEIAERAFHALVYAQLVSAGSPIACGYDLVDAALGQLPDHEGVRVYLRSIVVGGEQAAIG